MPSKHAKTTKPQKQPTDESEPEEKYERMACGTQVHFLNGQTSFSCIGRVEPVFKCPECRFYRIKAAK